MSNKLRVELIRTNKNTPLPAYATDGSAAIDLYADIPNDVVILAGEKIEVRTGYKIWLKDRNYAGLILPRSGLGSSGLVVKNLVGLVDADYQGELIVHVWNSNPCGSLTIPGYKSGKAFAQYVIIPVQRMYFEEKEEFSETTGRGASGFGSTSK